MIGGVLFDPVVPLPLIWGLAAAALLCVGLMLWRRFSGAGLRALALAALLLGLANPSWQHETRNSLPDIVLAVVDKTASQRIAGREQQTAEALAALKQQIARQPNTDLREVEVPDAKDDGGTRLLGALSDTLTALPRDQIAGVFVLSDGQIHDPKAAPDLPAPMHLLLGGQPGDWDRRLIVDEAPAFAILGEEITLSLRIEDSGAAPQAISTQVSIAIDGGAPQVFTIPIGRKMQVPLRLPHGGINVLQFTAPTAPGELTDRNNSAIVQINGVRDRLRVLLVSGEPYPGERTWRNLLKSDSAVDLVHFTILRPPDKHDGVPVEELSLIAFPTRELFLQKIEEFDLIIFDRYRRRGILPTEYLANVRRYVEGGGAVLVAAGPGFASADSLYRSPLGQILPAAPTSRVIREGFHPKVSDLGQRHPVTRGLGDYAPENGWGRWLRQTEIAPQQPVAGSPRPEAAQIVMTGAQDSPLLALARVGAGRVALLASDHAWLWSRGFEGGGPQLELLRRLAHWMMKEPELEEETLSGSATPEGLRITRRTLSDTAGPVTLTYPDGRTKDLQLTPQEPGTFAADLTTDQLGLYRITQDQHEAVVALGPPTPREFEQTVADAAALAPLIKANGGGIARLSDGLPSLRQTRAGRPAAGRGWLGITPRNAYVTTDVRIYPLLPPWAGLLLAAGLMVLAWVIEGRRSAPPAP